MIWSEMNCTELLFSGVCSAGNRAAVLRPLLGQNANVLHLSAAPLVDICILSCKDALFSLTNSCHTGALPRVGSLYPFCICGCKNLPMLARLRGVLWSCIL